MKNDFSKYKKVIVTDSNGQPMAWSMHQLCFCTNSDWQDEQFPLKVYTKATAKKYIKMSNEFRSKNGFKLCDYKLIPVA